MTHANWKFETDGDPGQRTIYLVYRDDERTARIDMKSEMVARAFLNGISASEMLADTLQRAVVMGFPIQRTGSLYLEEMSIFTHQEYEWLKRYWEGGA